MAIEVAKDFCRQKNYSVEGLSKELFYLFYNKCMFVHESDIVSNGVPNYIETQPKAFLSIILVNQKLEIKDDEIMIEVILFGTSTLIDIDKNTKLERIRK